MKSYIRSTVGEVYDPTCGDGALLAVFGDEVRKYGQELDGQQLAVARSRLANFEGVCGDTLQSPAFSERKFECIIANPPFSVKWEQRRDDERFSSAPALAPKSKADYAFLLHILHYLEDNGVAVVLNAPGVLYRGNAEGKIRRWLVEQNVIDRVVNIPGGYFVDTKIPTVLLVLRKDRSARGVTGIVFEDLKQERETTLTRDEIAANDFVLSGLLQPEPPSAPPIDPHALEREVEQALVSNVRLQLLRTREVSSLEGIDFLSTFIEKLDATIGEFRGACSR